MDTPRKPGRPKGALNKKKPATVVEPTAPTAEVAEVVEVDVPVPTPTPPVTPVSPPTPTPRSIVPTIEEEESDASS